MHRVRCVHTAPARRPLLQIMAPLVNWFPSMERRATLVPTMMSEVTRSHAVFQSSIFAGNLRRDGKRMERPRALRQQTAETVDRATCASLTSVASREPSTVNAWPSQFVV